MYDYYILFEFRGEFWVKDINLGNSDKFRKRAPNDERHLNLDKLMSKGSEKETGTRRNSSVLCISWMKEIPIEIILASLNY
jgi:hypothetical protein